MARKLDYDAEAEDSFSMRNAFSIATGAIFLVGAVEACFDAWWNFQRKRFPEQ